ILSPPAAVGDADVIVCESTYGDRIHDDEGALDEFARPIAKTIAAGGTVFVDSPMASAALHLYRRAIADGEEEIRPELRRAGDPFDHGRLIEIRDVEQ